MVDNSLTPWQHYTGLYQLQLGVLNQSNSRQQLYPLSQQLTAARLALAEHPTSILKSKLLLPSALARIEIIYNWCLDYQWPNSITSLLLQASFCSSLSAELIPTASNALPKHPALSCAKYNQPHLPSNVLIILSHCYAAQRRLTYTRQQALSTLLTLAEQLTASPLATKETAKVPLAKKLIETIQQQMAIQIMYSCCEHELSLLAILAKSLRQTITQAMAMPVQPPAVKTLLSTHSVVAQLPLDDYAQLESYLQQHSVMAAHVMQRASQLNRQQQNITQIKLAISLLGLNALPLLLASAELQQQLADLKLPNHRLLTQFTQCFAVALLLLLPRELTKDKAHLIAYCLCAPLWLNQQNYLHAIMNVKPSRLNLPLATLVATPDYVTDLTLLLERYQLSFWQNPATQLIHYLNRKPSKITHLSLGILAAWQAAQYTLMGTTQKDPKLAGLQQLLLRLQQFSPANFSYQSDELCQKIARTTACYCPIQLDL